MSKTNADLLSDHEWSCAVHPPGRPQLAFAGTLRYSPLDGLTLEYSSLPDKEYDNEIDHLHGVTTSGDPFTLVGKFSTERAGFRARSSSFYHVGKHSFQYAIFGHHIDRACKFESFELDICGLRDFLTASDYSALASFEVKALFDTRTSYGRISGIQNISTTPLPRRLSDQIHCMEEDEPAMSKLQKAFDAIKLEHPEFRPFVKVKSEYRILIECEEGATIEQAYETCQAIADLFSIFFFGPAPLHTLTAQVIDTSGKRHSWEVFPAKLSETGSIKRATATKSYHHLPINFSDIDLGEAIKNWLSTKDDFRTLVCSLQSATTLISHSEILSRIVLSAAQLEGIAKKAKKNKDSEKYQYAIDAHASQRMIDKLCSLLQRDQAQLGKAIGDLRNDIAHMGRTSKIAHTLNTREKYMACIAFEAIIISYVLGSIGVSKPALDKYQKCLLGLA